MLDPVEDWIPHGRVVTRQIALHAEAGLALEIFTSLHPVKVLQVLLHTPERLEQKSKMVEGFWNGRRVLPPLLRGLPFTLWQPMLSMANV